MASHNSFTVGNYTSNPKRTTSKLSQVFTLITHVQNHLERLKNPVDEEELVRESLNLVTHFNRDSQYYGGCPIISTEGAIYLFVLKYKVRYFCEKIKYVDSVIEDILIYTDTRRMMPINHYNQD
ncbi:hypothetical protein MKS88_000627 [Plasmodium brasilianum]|uniref:Uncharacterized protein n=1 Tax=Plasmodium brasilianum TaxID=5824 RepID=A0ACB9YH24_PLABR|nr:hypothetical protein MKS88_000627 [Plasmodium brasilianum]